MPRWLLLLISLYAGQVAALENQLAGHPSPYLAMHGADPVAWQDWGPAVVERARKEDKLLFVSSGYFSCHWCHVMQRESYRDPAIATLLNTHFIPIKLDRELHTALDTHLIDFLERTQGQAGWPLNVFLTPEGYPLIGATYLPAAQFRELLDRLQRAWRDERGKLRKLARRTSLQIALENISQQGESLPESALRQGLFAQAMGLADVLGGGFGEQNKFPMTPQLMALLELQQSAPRAELAEFLMLTLDRMADEGLRDHLAGGFFRYTVDPSWDTPHFEKMLYSQAMMAELYLRAADVFGREDYARIARDTLDFVLREMPGAQGGYVASFSAVDGSGEEGAVYLWRVEELHAALGEQDTALARRHWRMLDVATFGDRYLPRRGEAASAIADALKQPQTVIEHRLGDIRTRLLAVRAQRPLPVDGKELAGWNGLMLATLSQAALRWQDPTLRRAAAGLRNFLRNRLWDGGELRRALDDKGRPFGDASLADYAYVAYGMSHYATLSGDPTDRTLVAALVNLAWQRYLGPAGWRLDDEPLIPGMGEESALAEGALPSPSAMLVRLALHSDDPALVAKGRAAAEQARAGVQNEPFWYAGHISALLESSTRAE